ncbi:MAG: glycosyltransferase family 4 protein, partial [Chitinivibrionia bacterium]|nr:glycosyltransferase family 4 protein [Chitinivibrionia bacterium]
HSAAELRKRGHEVLIVTTRFGKETAAEPGVARIGRNILVPMNGALVNMTVGTGLGAKLRRILNSFGPDIVHTHCPLVPTLPLLSLRTLPPRSKVVGTFHAAADSNYAYRLLHSRLAPYADRLDARIAVSQPAMNLVHKYFPGSYAIIPNGIDLGRFTTSAEAIPRYRDGVFTILFVGRLDARKGLKYLIRAASLMAESSSKRIRLLIVGDDGARRLLLPRPGRNLEVVFAGMVSRESLVRHYASCDVFCSPATGQESFGIVLLEAMATGVPVVSTSIPGYLTLLKDGWNALVVPPRDPGALCAALRKIADDGQLRSRLADNGLQFVRRYAWDQVAGALERLYLDTIASRRTEPKPSFERERTPQWA